MNDLLTDPRFHSIIVAAIVSLGVWLVKWLVQREAARIDRQFEHIEKQLADTVKKRELQQLRSDMDERHEENREDLREIKTTTTGTHQRIDQLYRDLIDRAGRKSG